jgi:hypothetical protein
MQPVRAAFIAIALTVTGCGGGGGGSDGGTRPPADDTPDGGAHAATPDPVDTSALAASGTIAYVRGSELRVIEPDGRGDRLVWSAPAVPGQPTLTYSVRGAAWRPDGLEIAFTSDHEEAFSPYSTDVYAIRPDGKALRKITNGPTRARMVTFPRGTVRVAVSNATFDYGPYFVLILGGEVKMQTIPPGATVTVTFENVADLGAGLQPVVVANGLRREIGVSGADVQPGKVVDATPFTISGAFYSHGAHDPFWRGDGSAIGFFSGICLLQHIPAVPSPGFRYQPLVSPDAFTAACGAAWGPTPATRGELLLADSTDYDGTIDILRVSDGATSMPAPVASVEGYHTPTVQWMPDGGGFYVAQAPLLETVQILEYRFGGTLTRVTDAHLAPPADKIRRFAVSPDGQRIAFERTNELFEGYTDTTTDLWIMDRDGSDPRLLAEGGSHPSWNPTR